MKELYEFGPYCLDVPNRLLMQHGDVITLAPKTFDLLLVLVRSEGRLLGKQELINNLWPDTFVEDANLTFQIATLRKALGPDAAQWIETVPKHGYRFAAPVTGPAIVVHHHQPSTPPENVRRPPMKRLYVAAAAVLAIAIALSVGIATRAPRSSSPAGLSGRAAAVPLTAYPGFQVAPTLSPDSSQVAFSWDGPGEDNFDIYVKLVGPGEPVRVTKDPAADVSPAWSPDGGRIAFLRFFGAPDLFAPAQVIVIPALGGGAERKIADIVHVGPVLDRGMSNLTWTSDGQWIAFGGKFSEDDLPGIWLLSVGTGERRRLTTGHRGDIGDVAPTFSPDGLSLAFIRGRSISTNEVYVLPLTAKIAPAGEARQITTVNKTVAGVVWTPDGRAVVYSVGGSVSHLERLPVDARRGGPAPTPQILPFGEQAAALSVSRTNGRLVYARRFRDSNIWRISLPSSRAAVSYAAVAPVRLIASTFLDHTPDYSPDGTKIAFASMRSGVEEIWIAHADGSVPVQLTFLGGPHTANPQWSPDGHDILFNARREGSSDLYLITPATGSVRRLTQDPADEIEARWSRDGRWIYFGSNRTGRYEVYKMPASAGPAVQVTKDGGISAQESQDGAWLYYSKSYIGSVWRIPCSGGKEEPVLNNLSYSSNFVVVEKGIYFVAGEDAQSGISIDFFDFTTGETKSLLRIQKRWWYGMAISPDQRSLLFSVVDHEGSNLMFVEGFR